MAFRPGGLPCLARSPGGFWRDSGEVGDSSAVRIELGIRDGLVSSWYLHDEPE